MALLKPFRALRPIPERAKDVSCVPYDVVYESEVREFIEANPMSFLRVTRAEADLPAGVETSDETAFARARENLETFIEEGIFAPDADDALYLYQLTAGGHSQTGIVGCCSLAEYEEGLIKKHENVRPEKVEDRTRHLLAVGAQTGLIFLAFRNTARIRDLITAAAAGEPIYNFECPDGIKQKVWRITETAEWEDAFADVPALYIADGHHRAESADRARKKLSDNSLVSTGTEDYNFVLAGSFPAEDLHILAYNRVIKDLNGLSREAFFARLEQNFSVEETAQKMPARRGEFHMYIGGAWYRLVFRRPVDSQADPVASLDVSILQKYVFEEILGIDDARTDQRIAFVGGKRGVDELEKIVDSGNAKLAFSMYPTTIDDMLAVSDMGEIMPPKSTWFEPKLKDGLLVHMIETNAG